MGPVCRAFSRAALAGAALALAAASPVGAAPEPFSFLTTPTDQLAVPGEVAGTEITPEGYLYTGHTELVFDVGSRLRPFVQPLRTLAGGRYPVVASHVESGGVRYRVELFASPVAGRAVDFVRVELRNTSRRPARARFAAAVRHAGGGLTASGGPRFRFRRPAVAERPGLYLQPGTAFDPGAAYAFAGHTLTRGGRALYLFPRAPAGAALRRELRPDGAGDVGPGTRFGRSGYTLRLAPRRRVVLDFKLPVTPISPAAPAFAAIARASSRVHRARTLRYWRRVLSPAMRVDLPERKVEDAFYAALVTNAQSRYRTGDGQWVQAVNKLQYHSFYLRDAAIVTNSLDLVGLHDLARENLAFFSSWQDANGLFISRPGQYDGHGQALWALGEHARRGGDPAFARAVFPAVSRGVDWLAGARRRDPLGVLPAGDPRDNELVAGHLSGDNFWALAGLERAVELARMLGEREAAERFAAEQAALRAAVVAQVRRAALANDGRIPPALDVPGGQDWGNLWASYPVQVLPPADPAVEATVRHVRRRFREGIATYLDGRLLHHYLGFRVLQTELLGGRQRRVVRGLYDALAHTTATHGGFETGIHPGGSRSVDDNPSPHGWYAAEYVALLRNMLVREEGRRIVLGSALSPAWLRPGRAVRIGGAPTPAGRVSFSLHARRGGAVLRWRAPAGADMSLTVPAGVRDVRARGLDRRRRSIRLGRPAGRIAIRWRLGARTDTYVSAVRRLRRSYPG